VRAEQPGLFRVVAELQGFGGVSEFALASAVSSPVAGEAEHFPLLGCLQDRLKMLRDATFHVRVRGDVANAANRPLTSHDLWPRHDGMPIRDGWAHRAAATLWPDLYMQMLASFPALFQHWFWNPLRPLDLELVTSLVEASPAVFSSDGAPLG